MQNIPSLFFVTLIKGYQTVLSPLLGSNCRYEPTCSQYAIDVIKEWGSLKGSVLALKRIHDGGIFIIKEFQAKRVIISAKPSYTAAIGALKVVIDDLISLYFEEEWNVGYELPSDFNYEEWYQAARDRAYNEDHVITLRNFIEGNE